jgi:hypothetical protein
MTFHQGKEHHDRAPCFPAYPVQQCKTCGRYRQGAPVKPASPVIDASALKWLDKECGMYAPETAS